MIDFESLFGPNNSNRPMRREAQVQIAYNGAGNRMVEASGGEAFFLSDQEGSVDHLSVVRRDLFFSCGCSMDRPTGGQCAEPGCGRVSCDHHFEQCRCKCCGKPLCISHAIQCQIPGITGNAWCHRCYDEIRRRYNRQQVLQFLTRPFARKAK